MVSFSAWDIALIITVTVQASVLAFVHRPILKGLMLTIPLPFTLAYLSLGNLVNTTNTTGLIALLVFMHGVRIMYVRLKVPILIAIALASVAYCAIAWNLAAILPKEAWAFWLSFFMAFLCAGVVYAFTPHRAETGYRSPVPLYIKVPIIALVVFCLILIKRHIGGFFTVFPMVSLIGVYEARRCLWTVCRLVTAAEFGLLAMFMVIRLMQPRFGVVVGLAAGWVVLLAIVMPYMYRQIVRQQAEQAVAGKTVG